jgi:hypothetical protein
VPQTGDENVRINLWLSGGNPPTNTNEVEVVLKSFQFVPLGSPQPARLTNITTLPGGQVHFDVAAQYDRRNQVPTSANLVDWQSSATLLATNTLLGLWTPTPQH